MCFVALYRIEKIINYIRSTTTITETTKQHQQHKNHNNPTTILETKQQQLPQQNNSHHSNNTTTRTTKQQPPQQRHNHPNNLFAGVSTPKFSSLLKLLPLISVACIKGSALESTAEAGDGVYKPGCLHWLFCRLRAPIAVAGESFTAKVSTRDRKCMHARITREARITKE